LDRVSVVTAGIVPGGCVGRWAGVRRV